MQSAPPRCRGWIDDLIDTMHAVNGAGIAANQIGIPYRLFAVEVRGGNPRYPYKPPIPLAILINPVVSFLSDETFENYEGCLSVPNLRGAVMRHLEVSVSGYDRDGAHQSFEVRGYSAGTFQHENDHLDGVLFPTGSPIRGHSAVGPRSRPSARRHSPIGSGSSWNVGGRNAGPRPMPFMICTGDRRG